MFRPPSRTNAPAKLLGRPFEKFAMGSLTLTTILPAESYFRPLHQMNGRVALTAFTVGMRSVMAFPCRTQSSMNAFSTESRRSPSLPLRDDRPSSSSWPRLSPMTSLASSRCFRSGRLASRPASATCCVTVLRGVCLRLFDCRSAAMWSRRVAVLRGRSAVIAPSSGLQPCTDIDGHRSRP